MISTDCQECCSCSFYFLTFLFFTSLPHPPPPLYKLPFCGKYANNNIDYDWKGFFPPPPAVISPPSSWPAPLVHFLFCKQTFQTEQFQHDPSAISKILLSCQGCSLCIGFPTRRFRESVIRRPCRCRPTQGCFYQHLESFVKLSFVLLGFLV